MLDLEKTTNPDLSYEEYPLAISQLKAGEEISKAILAAIENNPNLREIYSGWTTPTTASRTACIIASSGISMNYLAEKRVFTDSLELNSSNYEIGISDFYHRLLPFHGFTNQETKSANYHQGWRVVSDTRDAYHHAVIAWAESYGVSAKSVTNFNSVLHFQQLVERGCKIVVSLDNSIIPELTIRGDDNLVFRDKEGQIFINGINEQGKIQPRQFISGGRHALPIIDISEGYVTFIEPFILPQAQNKNPFFKINVETMDEFLPKIINNRRAIIFSSSREIIEENIGDLIIKDVFIPSKIRDQIKKQSIL